jgi:hypothetical protein
MDETLITTSVTAKEFNLEPSLINKFTDQKLSIPRQDGDADKNNGDDFGFL